MYVIDVVLVFENRPHPVPAFTVPPAVKEPLVAYTSCPIAVKDVTVTEYVEPGVSNSNVGQRLRVR